MRKAVTIIFVLLLTVITNAQVFDWEWQNPKPTGNDQNAVAVLNDNTVLSFGTSGSLQKTTNGGTDWTVSYIDNSYRDIKAAAFVNSSIGYITGTAGLIMKTIDGGLTWTTQTVNTTEDILSIDYVDKDTLYAGGSNGLVLKTTNGGSTWAVSSYGSSYIYKVYVVNASTIFLGSNSATTGRIIRSTNYGASWASVTPAAFTSGTVYAYAFSDANTGIAAASGASIYKTTDGGATWTNKGALTSSTVYTAKFITSAKALAGDAAGNVYVSTDAGETWASVSASSQKLLNLGSTANAVYAVGGAGTVVKSTDGGATWANKYSAVTQYMLRDLKFFDNLNGLASGGSSSAADSLGQMFKTTDGGKNWSLVPFNFGAQVYCFARPSASVWYAATGNNKVFKSTDGGLTFKSLTLPVTGTTQVYWDMAFSGTDTGYVAGATGKLLKTTDGGNTWTLLTTNVGTNTIYKVKIAGNAVFIAGIGAKLSKSTDGGTTWTALTPNIPGTFFTLGFRNANIGYVAGSNVGVARTTDGGTTWAALTLPSTLKSSASIWSVTFGDSSTVWMTSVNGDVVYSKDEGLTWTAAKKPTSNSLFASAAVNGDLWLAGNGGAIIKGYSNPSVPVELTSFTASVSKTKVVLNWKTATEKNNSGFEVERKLGNADWQKIGFVYGNGTSSEVKNYTYTDNLVAQNASYRLKQIDFDGTYTYSATVAVNSSVPNKFALQQNYPNPFNPATTISFQVGKSSKVTLKIYNVLGSEVATLVDEVKEAGSYTVQFDAARLASGVYYYTLKSGSFSDTKKMLLLK